MFAYYRSIPQIQEVKPMKIKKEIPVKVAVIQMEPHVGETERNLQLCLQYVSEAADNGAQLIVLPELCVSGYVFANREEAFSLSEPVPEACHGAESLCLRRPQRELRRPSV